MATDYAMESEMLILAARHRVRVVEVEIETVYHDNYKGTTPLDGVRVASALVKRRVKGVRQAKFAEDLSLDTTL